MSRLTALLLVGIISCQAFYNVGVLGYWVANRAYITTHLCENRTRPQVHCNGKCYLKKKLVDAGNPVPADGSQLPGLKKGLELAECPGEAASHLWRSGVFVTGIALPSGDDRCAAGFPHTVFHPPAGRA